MKKTQAIALLGGTVSAAAKACGITSSAVSQWPDDLTKNQVDRVQAALLRMQTPRRRARALPEPVKAI